MIYHISYDAGVLRGLSRLPKQIQARIVSRIELLGSNPRATGSIKLQGEEAYRVRVGDYRIIYQIHDRELIVLVIDIGHRGDVYRRR